MPLNRDFIGRAYPASGRSEVAREKIRDFATAIGDLNPVYLDPEAARAAGHADVIAPPTFLTIARLPLRPTARCRTRRWASTTRCVVHGEQRFVLHRPVVRRRRAPSRSHRHRHPRRRVATS